ncbi:helix-turn-helix domain-containing protein [Micromonospora sp. NPDC051296]|uniref:helix-turn-helix domain-containing protein n=1 Tax=Micromonospora sp. NPDC051296 TaxID=3155046 RepID=UPI00343448B0
MRHPPAGSSPHVRAAWPTVASPRPYSPRGRSESAGTNTERDAFADTLRRRRRSLGLRQGELSDLAGVSERFVYALENGKRTVHLDNALARSSALRRHSAEILDSFRQRLTESVQDCIRISIHGKWRRAG